MRGAAIHDTDLHAFVDGELDAARAEIVQAHLRANATDSGIVDEWRRQNAAIRHAYDRVARESLAPLQSRPAEPPIRVPDSTPNIGAIRTARRRRRFTATVSAFLGGACVALLGTIAFVHPNRATDRATVVEITQAAPLAHAQHARLAWRIYAREPDAGAGDRSIPSNGLERMTALSAVPGMTALPAAPDLTRDGLDLIGRRVMPGVAAPASFLLYETSAAHVRMAVVVERTSEGDSPAVAMDDAGLRSLAWRSGGYAISLVAPTDADTLRQVARTVAATFVGR